MKNELLVSVHMITYGHEAYIKQAIESVLMQETDFEFDLIIADDCSPDKTPEIINEIIKTNPKSFRIKYFRHLENMGMHKNGIFAFSKCTGKYFAICEGDDYWTDPLKLQKQVDFLESHEEFSLVCHDALKINEMTNTSSLFFGPTKKKQICSTKDALNVHFCPTDSILFRREAILPLSDFNLIAGAGDQALVQFLSLHGLLYRMYDVMSVYRKTATGTSEAMKKDIQNTLKERINSLKILNEISNHKYRKYIRIENLLIQNRIDLSRSRSNLKTSILKVNRRILSIIKRII